MRSIIDELRSLDDKPLSEEVVAHLLHLNALYRFRLITYNELCIGLGGKSIGVAGDRFALKTPTPDRPRFQ
jgi:hypothetical protein